MLGKPLFPYLRRLVREVKACCLEARLPLHEGRSKHR